MRTDQMMKPILQVLSPLRASRSLSDLTSKTLLSFNKWWKLFKTLQWAQGLIASAFTELCSVPWLLLHQRSVFFFFNVISGSPSQFLTLMSNLSTTTVSRYTCWAHSWMNSWTEGFCVPIDLSLPRYHTKEDPNVFFFFLVFLISYAWLMLSGIVGTTPGGRSPSCPSCLFWHVLISLGTPVPSGVFGSLSMPRRRVSLHARLSPMDFTVPTNVCFHCHSSVTPHSCSPASKHGVTQGCLFLVFV